MSEDLPDLPLECSCGCHETEERNICTDDILGIFTPVEWVVQI